VTRRVVLAIAAALIASAVACARVERLVEPAPKPPPGEGAYSELRERWTRKASLYDGFAMRAFATATYQAPELRRARVDRTAAWKAMTSVETAALHEQEDSEAAKFDEFVLSMTTADPNDNDLDSRKTTWRVALVSPGDPDRVDPEIDEIRPDAMVRTLYPTVGDFDIVYRIRFSRLPGRETWAQPFTLRLAGPRGRLEFAFGEGAAGAPAGTGEAAAGTK